MQAMRRRGVTGSPKTVRAGIEDHATRYQVEEIMLVTICFDFAKRKRSYELIAQEFELAAQGPSVEPESQVRPPSS